MNATMSVQLDPDTLLKLISQLRRRGGSQDLSEAINEAIEFWLTELAKLRPGSDPASLRGYQWKSLFLPEGTVLQSWSYGENNYARVEGDQIIHNGQSVSPNQFAQSFARTNRNAWTDLSVRRPCDKQFKRAYRLRQELAAQAAQPQDVARNPATAAVSEATAIALIVALQKQAAQPVACSAPPAPRDTTPSPNWNLPERRKFRYRLEDVAFD